ncbi:MAG: lipopolysaccharide biosynthesis protein [Rikenellaceae bacterium]
MELSSNKRIARNTLMLYIRMFVLMGVGLYTSRVVLGALGVDDFGIYNVVGGVVIFFTFINGALSSATQRFLNFEMGRGDSTAVKRVFGAALAIHCLIALVVLLLAESVGLWFLNSQLNIPEGRMAAANFIYQCSVLTTCVSIMTIPYNATVVAHERMSFFAYLSLVEGSLKLLVAFALVHYIGDRLEFYGLLMLGVSVVVLLSYYLYCRRKFATARFTIVRDRGLYVQLFSFSGWSLLGSVAVVGANQGVNMLLNIFFGVALNAAAGVANQVNSAVSGFVGNFQTAFRPSIVKLYAAGEVDKLNRLIITSTKFSFFLIYLIATPLMLNIDRVLSLWLPVVPELASGFAVLVLISSIISALSAPLWMTVQAVGRIRNYQIVMSLIIISTLLFSYIALECGASALAVFVVKTAVELVCLIARVLYTRHFIAFSLRKYFYRVALPVTLIVVCSMIIPALCYYFDYEMGLVLSSTLFFVITIPAIFLLGLTPEERAQILKKIR